MGLAVGTKLCRQKSIMGSTGMGCGHIHGCGRKLIIIILGIAHGRGFAVCCLIGCRRCGHAAFAVEQRMGNSQPVNQGGGDGDLQTVFAGMHQTAQIHNAGTLIDCRKGLTVDGAADHHAFAGFNMQFSAGA